MNFFNLHLSSYFHSQKYKPGKSKDSSIVEANYESLLIPAAFNSWKRVHRVHRVHLFNLECTLYNKNPLDARKNGEKNEQINENTDIRRVVVPNTTLLAQ